MEQIKAFGGSKNYTLESGVMYKETDLIPIEETGWLSFIAKMSIAGTTVTPTVYYFYGEEAGNAQSLKDQDNSDAATFISTAAFECSLNKQSHFKAAIGIKVRFTFDTITTGAVLTCEFAKSRHIQS